MAGRNKTEITDAEVMDRTVRAQNSSVCVLFYAPGGGIKGIKILDDTEVYKNKPDAIARVQGDLCIRWLVVDHYSGAYFAHYR